MTDPKLHELLDQTRFGDVLTLAHSNGKHTASVSGPVLTDQTRDPAVGIHLLDGDPHVVRTSTGVVWAPVVHAALHRGGEVIAKWDAADHLEAQTEASLRRGLADITAGRTVDLGSFAQPATAPPAAQQDDSGYTPLPHEGFARLVDGGVHLGKPDSVAQAEGQRWLDGIRAEVREQIARELQHEAKAMTRFNAHPAMSTSDPTYREGIRVGLAAAALIARQEQP